MVVFLFYFVSVLLVHAVMQEKFLVQQTRYEISSVGLLVHYIITTFFFFKELQKTDEAFLSLICD